MELIKNKSTEKENKHHKKILVVEDNPICIHLVANSLYNEGYHVDAAKSLDEALLLLTQSNYQLLVLDWKLPNHNGDESIRILENHLSKENLSLPFVLYTGTDPLKIQLPHTTYLKFIDYWDKSKVKAWKYQIKSIYQKIKVA